MHRVHVIGAGAMGCLFAARIAESGADVVLIDVDRQRLDAIAQNGITLTDDNGERVVRVQTGVADAVTASADLVLLFTKGMHSRTAIRSVRHLVSESTFVLTLQNGLGNPEIVAEELSPDQVLKGMAAMPADLHDLTAVTSQGSGHVELGALTPAGTQAAHAAAALLTRSGFDAHYNADVDIAIWEKVAFNAALNVLAAVTGQANAGMNNAPGRRIADAILDEVIATAHASGVAVHESRIRDAVELALTAHGEHKASMLQDMIAGRASEIEGIDGAVCERAAALGVPTPVTSTMTDLVRLMELVR